MPTGPLGEPHRPSSFRQALPSLLVGSALIAATLLAVMVVLATRDRGDATAPASGRYSMAQVSNGCDLVDLRVLSRWAPQRTGEPAHQERRGSSLIGGGGADCSFASTGNGRSARADFALDAELADRYGASPYGSWVDAERARSAPGRSVGELPGLGQRAMFAADEVKTDYSHRIEYTVATQDDNLAVRVRIGVFVDDRTQLDPADVERACIDAAQRVFERMRQRGV